MPNEEAFHQGHTGYVVVGETERVPISGLIHSITVTEAQAQEIEENRRWFMTPKREEPSLPDLPAHVASVLLEKYAGMRQAAKEARDHYYRLDERVTQAEQDWMDARQQAQQMADFLRRAGVPVASVED